ncbi:MAG: hypothetical protein R3B99_08175 [Polyangiales bacterium]
MNSSTVSSRTLIGVGKPNTRRPSPMISAKPIAGEHLAAGAAHDRVGQVPSLDPKRLPVCLDWGCNIAGAVFESIEEGTCKTVTPEHVLLVEPRFDALDDGFMRDSQSPKSG